MTDSIHPYRRQRLEPEISAVSIELSVGPPLTIVNRDARRSSAVMAIKKLRAHALLAAVGTLAIEWLIRLKRRNLATAAVGTLSATSAVVIGVTPMIASDDQHNSPPAAVQVVTLTPTPAVTRTVTAPPRRPTAAPARSQQPTPTRRASQPTSSARPPYPASPSPTIEPQQQTASAEPNIAAPGSTDSAQRTSSAGPTSSSAAPAPAEATQPPQPAAKSCTLRVDLDPLLNLCAL